MKIEYRTIKHSNGHETYKEVRHKSCCSAMENAFEEDSEVVRFPGDCGMNPLAHITKYESGYYAGDGSSIFFPIKFCPFCGTAIVCEEVERAKIVETRREEMRREVRTESHEEVEWKKEG
jgi:hypothetical protein